MSKTTEQNEFPTTLQEAIKYFSNEDVSFEYMKCVRWPTGQVNCPRCQSEHVSFISTRKVWTCLDCKVKKQFTIRVGTILEDSPIKFDKWICAFWLIANAKNGISSYELARSIGVMQRTAWFMLQRIRLAMQNGTIVKLGGSGEMVEVDETYIGGLARNMHKSKRKGLKTGGRSMTQVMGILQRSKDCSKVVTSVVGLNNTPVIREKIRKHIKPGTQVFTDKAPWYRNMKREEITLVHKVIDHAKAYVDGVIHTNSLENFWCLLKRSLKGTYVNVEPFHLFRYLDEQAFRYNERKDTDQGRFVKAIKGIVGKSLTFEKLTGKEGGDLLPV